MKEKEDQQLLQSAVRLCIRVKYPGCTDIQLLGVIHAGFSHEHMRHYVNVPFSCIHNGQVVNDTVTPIGLPREQHRSVKILEGFGYHEIHQCDGSI